MNKSNIFSPTRFFCFWRKEARENRKSTLLQMGVLYGVLTLIMLVSSYSIYSSIAKGELSWYAESLQNGIDPVWFKLLGLFFYGLFATCAIHTSNAMNQMQSKAGRVNVLMTPVSAFEQYLTVWLRTLVGFLLAYLLCFALADFTRVLFFKILGSEPLLRPMYQMQFIGDGNGNGNGVIFEYREMFMFTMFGFFALHAFALLGAMVWRHVALLKTCAVLFVLSWIYPGIIMVTSYVLPNCKSSSDFYYPRIVFCHYNDVNIVVVFLAILTCFGWVVAYLRFREAEVIHRM